MKRYFTFFCLILTLLVGFISCGGDDPIPLPDTEQPGVRCQLVKINADSRTQKLSNLKLMNSKTQELKQVANLRNLNKIIN